MAILREGHALSHFRSDAIAGATVSIVALPLSMVIAIASGASPAQGFYTAIIGGFLVSALGGSRFQIKGRPAHSSCWLFSTVQRCRNKAAVTGDAAVQVSPPNVSFAPFLWAAIGKLTAPVGIRRMPPLSRVGNSSPPHHGGPRHGFSRRRDVLGPGAH